MDFWGGGQLPISLRKWTARLKSGLAKHVMIRSVANWNIYSQLLSISEMIRAYVDSRLSCATHYDIEDTREIRKQLVKSMPSGSVPQDTRVSLHSAEDAQYM